MNRQAEYRKLMEQVRHAHQAFKRVWVDARASALRSISPDKGSLSWPKVWQANGIAYKAAQALSQRRDRLLVQLFQEHLAPLQEGFLSGNDDAVTAIIDFLEVDIPAFRCGYAKGDFLRKLKTIPLSEEHRERLRQYGLKLCASPYHRREIREAGRLMILVANRDVIDQLRELTESQNDWIKKKAARMLGIVQNGRPDLR